jgi:hypothetical protein
MASAKQIEAAGKTAADHYKRSAETAARYIKARAKELGCTTQQLRDAMWSVISRRRDGSGTSINRHLAIATRPAYGIPAGKRRG